MFRVFRIHRRGTTRVNFTWSNQSGNKVKPSKWTCFRQSRNSTIRQFVFRSTLAFYERFNCDIKINGRVKKKKRKPLSASLVCRLILSLPERISSKFHICPRSFASSSAKYSFFWQSLSRGCYKPTYQPPEGVYLLNILKPFPGISILTYINWYNYHSFNFKIPVYPWRQQHWRNGTLNYYGRRELPIQFHFLINIWKGGTRPRPARDVLFLCSSKFIHSSKVGMFSRPSKHYLLNTYLQLCSYTKNNIFSWYERNSCILKCAGVKLRLLHGWWARTFRFTSAGEE